MATSPRQPLGRALLAGALLSLFTGCPDKSEPKASAPSAGEPRSSSSSSGAPASLAGGQKSAVPTSFDEVAAQLDAGGTFYVFLSTQQWLSGLSQQLASLRDAMAPPPTASKEEQENFRKGFALALDALKKSGLEQLTGVGASVFAPSAGLSRQKFFLSHPRGQGTGLMWSLLGPPPHKLDGLNLLPAQTALAFFGDLDLASLADFLHQLAEDSGDPQIKQGYEQAIASLSGVAGMPGDEALKALKGQAGLILTLDPAATVQFPMGGAGGPGVSSPRPSLALLLPAHDDRIFQQIDKMMAATPNTTRADAPGLQMRVMAEMPVTPELKLKPAVARWGDYIILASDEKLVHDIIDAKASGKGYIAQPEFATLKAGLPTEGNGFGVQTRLFAETFSRLQGELMKGSGAMPPQQLALMNSFAVQNVAAGYAVSTHLETGWLQVGNRTTAAGPSTGTLPAIMAAMAMPAFTKARDEAKATASLSNLRQIGMALQMYTGDHDGKFPATLEELNPKYLPDAKVLKSPFAPADARGYTYTAPAEAPAAEPATPAPSGSGLFGQAKTKPKPAPAAAEPAPADPQAVVAEDAHSVENGHVRIILHRDGSVMKENAL